jgi:hypothetical protein
LASQRRAHDSGFDEPPDSMRRPRLVRHRERRCAGGTFRAAQRDRCGTAARRRSDGRRVDHQSSC